LEALREAFDDRVISRFLWPPRSTDLTTCDFYLWGSLKENVYKTNLHTMEEVRNISNDIPTISDEELQRVNNSVFRRHTECIRSGGQRFQHCCSTGEFLLDFLKAIITAIACRLARFTDCYPSRDAAFEHGLSNVGPPFLRQTGQNSPCISGYIELLSMENRVPFELHVKCGI
jgi:hypothetical protein